LPGVAIPVRATETFAGLVVDCVGIANSERAAATNRDTSDVVPGLLVYRHLGSHHIAGFDASNGPGAHAVAVRETACRQLGPPVVPSGARLDCEPRLLPAGERADLTNTPPALIEDEHRHFRLLNFALSGLMTLPLRAISPRECCRPAFEQDPFRANPWLVCLAFKNIRTPVLNPSAT
jgi:hypothetical protein